MNTKDHDPLNPDEETKLYEALSMEKDDYNMLEWIRKHMRRIVKQEAQNTKIRNEET